MRFNVSHLGLPIINRSLAHAFFIMNGRVHESSDIRQAPRNVDPLCIAAESLHF